jgi:hypothetical protein
VLGRRERYSIEMSNPAPQDIVTSFNVCIGLRDIEALSGLMISDQVLIDTANN